MKRTRKQQSESPRQPDETDVRLPDPTEILGGEFSKSRQTRIGIMEAAIDCLAEQGYFSLSVSDVAKRADLTRAAVLYHYPSRLALIEAVVHYVTRKRIEMYASAMADIPMDDHFFEQAIDAAWEQLQTNEFLAFTELSIAARTDKELSVVFDPALAEYDRARRSLAVQLFPKSRVESPWFDLRRDIVRFLLEGLAQQGGLSFDADRRKAELVGFLKALNTEPESDSLLKKAKKWARREVSRRVGKSA